jgi:hypothetical protein
MISVASCNDSQPHVSEPLSRLSLALRLPITFVLTVASSRFSVLRILATSARLYLMLGLCCMNISYHNKLMVFIQGPLTVRSKGSILGGGTD